MAYFKFLIIINLLKTLQEKRNRAAFLCLQALGYPIENIRWGLITLNKTNISDLAKTKDISAVTLYAVLNGDSDNAIGQKGFEEEMGVEKELFFQKAINE